VGKIAMSVEHPKITVIGSFAVGMTLRAERFPVAGETLLGTDFDMGPGGKGSNQAVGAARHGVESRLVAMIGEDTFGDMAIQLYHREGVLAEHVMRSSEMNTGVGFITLNAAGENHIVLDMGANNLLSPEHVDAVEDLIAGSDVVMSVLEIAPATAGRAMALGRRHGVTAILNPAPAQPLGADVLEHVDILTPNESELRILAGLAPDDPTPTLDLAHRVQAAGVRTLVITRGDKGSLIVYPDGSSQEVPGITVDVVDTTGAGDAFNAALAVAVAQGKDLPEAAAFANIAGALACTALGVIPALPHKKDMEAYL
jgi:ribokinase